LESGSTAEASGDANQGED